MKFISWPEISNFHNLRKSCKKYPESFGESGKVNYFAKVKLDGTNAAVVITPSKEVGAQSRNKIITPLDDNMGFAGWVESQKEQWASLSRIIEDLIIFGEWCGKGIQKNVAMSKIDKKIFAVFCLVLRSPSGSISYIIEPQEIKQILGEILDVYVLPWYCHQSNKFSATINWLSTPEELQTELDRINQAVLDIEACDPWVKENFGVEGIGEGLVLYPVDSENWDNFSSRLFKAKGEKHKTIKQSAPAQANPEIANSVKEFADLVLTEARLEQGAAEVWKTLPSTDLLSEDILYSFDLKLMNHFLKWIEIDVKKETYAELEASNLTWDQVSKALINQARQWYLQKSKMLQ